MQTHFTVPHGINPSSTAPRRSKFRDGRIGLLSLLSKCRRNQNTFHRGDEIHLKQSRSISFGVFPELLFSHAGGVNHCKSNVIIPPLGYTPSGIIIILSWSLHRACNLNFGDTSKEADVNHKQSLMLSALFFGLFITALSPGTSLKIWQPEFIICSVSCSQQRWCL